VFRRILIANRGEVVDRVLRTCKRLGVEVVCVASSADRDLGFLAEADRVVVIGGARAAQSYLDQETLLEVARHTGCTAVHPGWGFLAENANFAARCQALGITFIGPGSSLMRAMGDKIQARDTMGGLGMPLVPGSPGTVDELAEAAREAERIGYPVLLKAAAGGGGRGMRRAHSPEELQGAFESATAESVAAFGDGRLYAERLVLNGRHIEFQVMVDAFGKGLHFGERECSIQRRHQKLLEESPSPCVTPEQREEVGRLVAGIAAAAGYRNAGTIEMLRSDQGELFFMEMNTRLQVEHPVTELTTGLDLVELQLRVAANQALPLSQDEVTYSGHAIEARINAEDPELDFRPCPGTITALELPSGEGIRVDTHLRCGDTISPHYDSMVAKVIAHGADRAQAIGRLKAALRAFRIEGVKTTIPLQLRVLDNAEFVSGNYDTGTLPRMLASEEH
jgi:acetyl-CoA carboxylase biotin carboxylase subunit